MVKDTDEMELDASLPTEDDNSVLEDEDGVLHDDTDIPDDQNFMKLFEESLTNVSEGKVVKGEIVQIDTEFVLVDADKNGDFHNVYYA